MIQMPYTACIIQWHDMMDVIDHDDDDDVDRIISNDGVMEWGGWLADKVEETFMMDVDVITCVTLPTFDFVWSKLVTSQTKLMTWKGLDEWGRWGNLHKSSLQPLHVENVITIYGSLIDDLSVITWAVVLFQRCYFTISYSVNFNSAGQRIIERSRFHFQMLFGVAFHFLLLSHVIGLLFPLSVPFSSTHALSSFSLVTRRWDW